MSSGATRLDLCPTLSLFVRLSLVKLGGHLFSIVLKSSSPATQGLCRKYHQFSFKTLNFQLGLKMALSCPVISSTKTLFPNLLYFHISEKKKKKKKVHRIFIGLGIHMPEFHSDLSVQEIKVRVVANRKKETGRSLLK